MNRMHFLACVLIKLSIITQCQVVPTWITSSFVQAESKKIINGDVTGTATGNSSSPTSTMTFLTPFPTVPNLGYGISGYQGTDYLGEEMWQVYRINLTSTLFTVKVQISGFTHLWVVQVRYIAISKSFPHHLNSFDNVPVNYTKGTLLNITAMNGLTRTYQNIVNYTTHATTIGSNYKAFTIPLSNNKILAFMTSMYLNGIPDQNSPGVNNNIDLWVNVAPYSNQTYRFFVTLGKNAALNRLHFSMIAFDQIEVQASGQYLLIYDKIQFNSSGGPYNFPAQLKTNFIIGFSQFSTTRAANIIHFIINYETVSGVHRANMPQSVTRVAGVPPIKRFCFSVFYLKTWTCPANTIFDPSINMCINCPLSNCLTCFNTTTCLICDTAMGFFLNPASGLCQCPPVGCLLCSSLTTCADCNEGLNYVLAPNQTCQLCQTTNNYFANQTTQTCEFCSLVQCLNCSSLTQCIQCNIGASYYLGIGGTCRYCDPATNYFINPVSKSCQLCSLSFCSICNSFSTCQTCQPGYILNSTDGQCYPCNLVGCLNCQSFSSCSSCDINGGYFLNVNNNQCQLCLVVGCINCADSQTCNECSTASNYILLPDMTCELCGANTFANNILNTCDSCSIPNCITCQTLNICLVCDHNNSYYLDLGVCQYCNATQNQFINELNYDCQNCLIAYCLQCSSLDACIQCDSSSNYWINQTDNLCYYCSVAYCMRCQNLTYCQVCDTANGYALNLTTGLCQLCLLDGCTNCSSLQTCIECDQPNNYVLLTNASCQLCDITNNYFPHATSFQCQKCTIMFCLDCTSLTSCSMCDTNSSYYIDNSGSCAYCNNTLSWFINMSTLGCQLCTIPNCEICSSLSRCAICNQTQNYLLNISDGLCYQCDIPNCLVCQNFTSCLVCDQVNSFFINQTNNLCQLCDIQNCLVCSSLYACLTCNTSNNFGLDFTNPGYCGGCNVSCICDGYGLPWDTPNQTCTPICGDGLIRGNEQCDDNNTDSFDGCSNLCIQQSYYQCIGQPSVCNKTLFIQADFISIEKNGCNSFQIIVTTPYFKLQQIKQNIYIANQGVHITKKEQRSENIYLSVDYSRDIVNQTILLVFSPGQQLKIDYNPLAPPLFYNQYQCNAQKNVQSLLQICQITSYVILLMSLLSCKIVGLELFGVLQLSYFSLSSHDFLNIYLAPLTKFKTFNGLNIEMVGKSGKLPQNLQVMNIQSNFINNCNLMLAVLFGELIISIIVYSVGKIIKSKKTTKIGLRLLKQGFITFALFNVFNISFSFGVHLKYLSFDDQSYLFSTLVMFGTLSAVLIAAILMQLTTSQDYGEYKAKFKPDYVTKIYVTLTIFYRMTIGFYTAMQNDYTEGPILILGLTLAFMLYFSINLPYLQTIQNYRAGIIHLTMLVIVLTSNYYRTMKSNTPLQIKGRLFSLAIIQLALIVLCILVSALVLAYQIFKIFKELCKKKKQRKTDPMSMNISEQHIYNSNMCYTQ